MGVVRKVVYVIVIKLKCWFYEKALLRVETILSARTFFDDRLVRYYCPLYQKWCELPTATWLIMTGVSVSGSIRP